MVSICFVSIVIGTGSLTLIAAVMNGFEQATHKKLQGVHADITISAGGKTINYEKLAEFLKKDYANTIKASSPSSTYHVMIETQSEQTYESSICALRAIDPESESLVSTFADSTIWEALKTNGIAIGQSLAKRLNITVGSEVTLIYHTQEDTVHKLLVTAASIFKTGIHDFDEQVLIASYDLIDTMYPHKVSEVSCSLVDHSKAAQVISSLQQHLSLEIHSWKDLYAPLVAALTLEKYAMWVILLLVTLVASLTIVSLLFMYRTHKRADIALLTSMGMPKKDLKNVFLCISGMLTFSATLCGIALAALGTLLLQTFPFISLPDVYYVTHLPAELDLQIIGFVLMIALLVSFCAGLFPTIHSTSRPVSDDLKGIR